MNLFEVYSSIQLYYLNDLSIHALMVGEMRWFTDIFAYEDFTIDALFARTFRLFAAAKTWLSQCSECKIPHSPKDFTINTFLTSFIFKANVSCLLNDRTNTSVKLWLFSKIELLDLKCKYNEIFLSSIVLNY